MDSQFRHRYLLLVERQRTSRIDCQIYATSLHFISTWPIDDSGSLLRGFVDSSRVVRCAVLLALRKIHKENGGYGKVAHQRDNNTSISIDRGLILGCWSTLYQLNLFRSEMVIFHDNELSVYVMAGVVVLVSVRCWAPKADCLGKVVRPTPSPLCPCFLSRCVIHPY